MKTIALRTVLLAGVFAAGGVVPAQTLDPGDHSAVMQVVNGKPFVDIMINDKGPFRFLVDTGTSGEAIITPELAQELDLPPLGETKLNDATGLGTKEAPIVLIESLELAGVEFTDVEALLHRLPSREGTYSGILGFRLFRNLLLTMDYVHQRIALAKGALSPHEEAVLPYSVPEGIPVIPLNLGGETVDAHVDSGGAGLTLPESIASKLQYTEGPMIFGEGQSLTTRFWVKAGKLASDVRLGPAILDHPWVEITDALPTVNVGSVPLQYFVVSFDQKHRLLRLQSPYPHIQLGVTPTPLRLINQPPAIPDEAGLTPIG